MAYRISMAAGLAVALTLFALSGYAQSYVFGQQNAITIQTSTFGVRFDDQAGTPFDWQHDSPGNANAQGMDIQNGMIWVRPIDTGGNQLGFDGSRNYWIQNSNTGTQINLDTEAMCVEQGAARSCF